MFFSLVSHAARPTRLVREAGKWSAVLLAPVWEHTISKACDIYDKPPPFARGASSSAGSVASFKDLSFGHGQNELLEKVNFSVEAGSKVTIMGQNGSGKVSPIMLAP